jgi:ubiquinone/menaquinone biosynthesis C-methylase UbiE
MSKMTSASTRHFGKVFDDIASEYDRNRPSYNEELIGHALQVAKLESGDRVLELGCGTGQLTQALVARGLHVTALEPGKQLIALAKQNLKGHGTAEFINARFEDVELPKGYFKAVFSASAFHWIEPDISWKKTADLLMPGGVLALIQYFGLKEQRTAKDLQALLVATKKVAPAMAAAWPQYYALDEIIDGVEERRENVSDVWSWLGSYDLARSYVSHLFNDIRLTAVPILIEQTADELSAIIRTISYYSRLSDKQRKALDRQYKEIYKKLGRSIRSSTVNILITAQRTKTS